MEEFTSSTGMKIFYGLMALFLTGFSLFLFSIDRSKTGNEILVLPITLMLLAALIIVSQFKRKIIISADSIIRINAFGTKEMQTSNIKGCRISQKVISIEPLSPSSPKIIISNYSDLSNSKDLVDWLRTNFTDLDSEDLKQEQDRLSNDVSLGFTKEEREKKLSWAKQLCLAYNIWGGVFGFAMIFFNRNFFATIFLLVYPLAGILIIVIGKGLIKFISDGKKSFYPFIFLGFFIPAFVLLLKSIDYEIEQYTNVWIPFMVSWLIVFVILLTKGLNNVMQIPSQIIMILIFSAVFAYGCTIQVNCAFDKSNPQIIKTLVYDVDIRHNKGTHYYLRLNSWGADQKPKSMEVSSGTFYKYPIGSSIDVKLKKGLLSIPWYYL